MIPVFRCAFVSEGPWTRWGSQPIHGGFLAVPGASWNVLAASGSLVGPLASLFGASWGRFRRLLGPPGRLLDPLGALWGALGGVFFFFAILDEIDRRRGGPTLGLPLDSPLSRVLGPFLERPWGNLGRSWGRIGALLGSSWSPHGPSWSDIEATEGHRKRKSEEAKNVDF